MRVRVLPLPHEPLDLAGDICVVVDVIRATTALVSLFEAGCRRIYLSRARSDAATVRLAVGDACVLCAERDDGSVPLGFDYEPSPARLSQLDLRERVAFLATANGTPAALAGARGSAGLVLLAALRNLSAAAECAAQEAAIRACGVTVLCSGRLRNTRIALEDVYCAGAFVQRLVSTFPTGDGRVELDDSAVVARRLAASFPDAWPALRDSLTGRRFIELGREDDVRFCASVDASTIVPAVVGRDGDTRWPVELLDAL